MSTIKFYSPSYKRADTSITQDYLPYCKYVVAEFEASDYKTCLNFRWLRVG